MHIFFFLLFTLLQVVINEEKKTIDGRFDLLEIAINYLRMYREMYSKTKTKFEIANNKTVGPLFDNALINDSYLCINIIINDTIN